VQIKSDFFVFFCASGEHCRDGLPACYVFFARMRGHFGVLYLAIIATMDFLPCFMFFCANARSFWGVAAGELCSGGLPACFYVIFARMRGHFGVLQPWTACLLHFMVWQECQLQHLIIFLAGTLTAYRLSDKLRMY